VERRFELIQPAPYAREQFLTLRRQLDLAPAAPEQWHLQVILECLDLHAHRRGCHVQRLGGFREAQPRRDRFEDAQCV